MPLPHAVAGLGLFLAAIAAAPDARACGPESDCALGDRHYRIYLPADADGTPAMGAIIFAHGYKGTAAGTLKSAALRAMADRLGVALIAAKSAGDDWSIPGAPSIGAIDGADELAYFDAVRADATRRFGIDPDRLIAAGFSAGGMMTWTLACHRSADYAAFVPMAGTFWRPIPETCSGPVADIIHLHGTADRIVPLEGRRIEDARQGAIRDAIAMYARFGAFAEPAPRRLAGTDCEERRNPDGARLSLCLFDGGHSFDTTFLESAWTSTMTDRPSSGH